MARRSPHPVSSAPRHGPAAAGILALLALVLGGLGACGDDDGPRHATPRTLILLSVDALRRDHVSAYTPEGMTPHVRTPHLDALLDAGRRFDDARTPVPLTLPSHTCMLSGLPPARTGVRVNTMRLRPPEERPFALVSERLRAAGWRTGGFVSAATLAAERGLDAGFEAWDDGGLGQVTGTLEVPERPGADTVRAALAWLSSLPAEAPAFCFVHLFEPHAPYASGSYGGDVADADAIVGQLREGLTRLGRTASCGWIVTADHGEALGELGEATHGILLQDSVMRVPFGLAGPGIPAGSHSSRPTSVSDVAPTLATWAGLPAQAPTGPGAGVDLRAEDGPAEDRIRVAESLYGHHRYGWAQLLGAVPARDPEAGVGALVSAGTNRLHILPPVPFDKHLDAPHPPGPGDAAWVARAGKMIASYKQSEAADLLEVSASQGGGYGAGGPVTPFLPDNENARLPDPHVFVANADRLDRLAARTQALAGARDLAGLEAVERQLRRMANADATNPEVAFRLGRVHMARMVAETLEAARVEAARAAEQAFGRAWLLGRHDPGTLVAWCGVNAGGREEAMLERLQAHEAQVGPWPCMLHILRIRLLRATNAPEERLQEACDAAQATCLTERERTQHAEGCGPR